MKTRLTSAGKWTCAAAVLLTFMCMTSTPAVHAGEMGVVKLLLQSAGIKAQTVKLDRADGFSKAMLVESPQGITVMVGVNQNNCAAEKSFLISVDGKEDIVRIYDDGDYEIENIEGSDLATSMCIINAIFNVLIDLQSCADSLCEAQTVFNFIISLISCTGAAI